MWFNAIAPSTSVLLYVHVPDGLCAGDADGFAITEDSKAFSRMVASRFDAYLGQAKGRHSIAV